MLDFGDSRNPAPSQAATKFSVLLTFGLMSRNDAPYAEPSSWLLWPVAFVAVALPMWQTYSAAAREAKQDGYFELRHVQLDALGWTTFIAVAAFLIFAFFPILMRSAYPWIPYMG